MAGFCSEPKPLDAPKLAKQRFRFFQIGGVEAFGEPAIDRRERVARFAATTLVALQAGEACRRLQFPQLGVLLAGDAQRFAIQFLSGLGLPLPQQQLAFVPVQFGREPALACPLHDL